MDNWIKTSDKFPQDSQRVIFYTCGYIANEMRMGCYISKDQWGRPNMFIGDGYFNEHNVSHWMPIPSPPNE